MLVSPFDLISPDMPGNLHRQFTRQMHSLFGRVNRERIGEDRVTKVDIAMPASRQRVDLMEAKQDVLDYLIDGHLESIPPFLSHS